MKVLVACEESQEVCKAFKELGHEAYSCDILPCSGGHPEWHIQDDVRYVIKARSFRTQLGDYIVLTNGWDLIIAHPACTHLASSGARWFSVKQPQRWDAICFFMIFTTIDCPRVAIEQPIGIMSTVYRKPDQIIQPWQFGHAETKATCLWLKGLPLLKPTNIVEPVNGSRLWRLPPTKDRAQLRSKTFPGIAKAMAEQWEAELKEK